MSLGQYCNGDRSLLRWSEEAVRGRHKKTENIRAPKGSRPLGGTHKAEEGIGKNMIGTLSFGVLVVMGRQVVGMALQSWAWKVKNFCDSGEDGGVEGYKCTEKGERVSRGTRWTHLKQEGQAAKKGGLAGSAGPSWQ